MKPVAAVLLVLCYLAVTHAWKCSRFSRPLNPVRQIDAGLGGVVIRDNKYTPYFLSGRSWYKLGTYKLQHVSVGPAGFWGSYRSSVYKYVAGNFAPVYGLNGGGDPKTDPCVKPKKKQISKGANALKLWQVDAGGLGQVVGTSSANKISCLRSSYAQSYKGVGKVGLNSLRNGMRYYSCSPNHGCWGVGVNFQVLHTQKISPTTCRTSSWRAIKGLTAAMVEVGTDGSVFAVCKEGDVYQRTGITSRRPYGSRWAKLPLCGSFRHVSYDLGVLWIVEKGGNIMRCTR